ncbi:MAG TPA: family 10 glycosylhydrolase [Membranihabitans sp.]|nr:family 10 glycosylhydrolase [Membranihabitans sp.]
MRRIFTLILILYISFLHAQSPTPSPLHEFRGVWVATVANIDWPSKPGLTSEEQKRELLWILDQHQRWNINSIMLQIRPTADAFYDQGNELWSYYLTGEQGKAPNPLWDPLAFATGAAHARSMELHAWFNPYRASQDLDPRKRSKDHISYKKPDWFFTYDNKTYFNPGIPEVREYIVSVIMDVVHRYDVDGIHFDDYFYPYPGKDPLPDSLTYLKYGKDHFQNIEDWRRDNVDQLIRQLHKEIQKAKPYVKFGISPFAIWRNKKEDPRGSDTNGFTSYDGLYADVYKWLEMGWVDYINPQIYFPFHYPPAAFEKLLDWWDSNSFGKQVLVGQAPYRALEGKNGWEDWSQLPRQVRTIRTKNNIHGSVYFSSKSLLNNLAGFSDSLRTDLYRHPSLPPPLKDRDFQPVKVPTNLYPTVIDRFVRLRWQWEPESNKDDAYGFVVYRFEKDEPIRLEYGNNVIAIRFSQEKFYFDTTCEPGKQYTYVVRPMDRNKYLGPPSETVIVHMGR